MAQKSLDKDLVLIRRAAIVTGIIGIPIGCLAAAIGGVGFFSTWDARQAEVNDIIAGLGIGLPIALLLIYYLIYNVRNASRQPKQKGSKEWLK